VDAAIHGGLLLAPVAVAGAIKLLQAVDVGSQNSIPVLRIAIGLSAVLSMTTVLFVWRYIDETLKGRQTSHNAGMQWRGAAKRIGGLSEDAMDSLFLQQDQSLAVSAVTADPVWGRVPEAVVRRSCRGAVVNPVKVVMILTESRLLLILSAVFGLVHFGVSGANDSLSILYTNLLFGWEAATQSLWQLCSEIASVTTLLLLYPVIRVTIGERGALIASCLGRAAGAACIAAAAFTPRTLGEWLTLLGGTQFVFGVYLSALLRAIASAQVDSKRQAQAMR
jgi:hypothetical protein